MEEQQQKESPVEIVQKLIAIHTTRKEAGERMIENSASASIQDKLKSVTAQSDSFIQVLLNELSEFGDAVQSEVNREDKYHEIWNKSLSDIDTMNAASLAEIFKKSEDSLADIYSDIADTNQELPTTLNDILHTQLQEIKQTL